MPNVKATTMELEELLNECVEALCGGASDGDCREEHIEKINEVLANDGAAGEIGELLQSAATIFREHQKITNLLCFAVKGFNSEGVELAKAIRSKLGGSLPRYIYHGTVYKHLADISQNGLASGKIKVWGKRVPKHFLDEAVFFDTSWRSALGWWAEMAHLRMRGRRDSKARTPVVIRLAPAGLELERDPLAAAGNCLMVRGRVSVNGAHVLLGRVRGFPKWQLLPDVLSTAH